MRERRSKDDFEISNKNRIKIQKKERNGPLRSNKPPPKSLVQSPENSDDDEYQSKLLNRGSEWWAKVDHRFFREMPGEQVQALMERTTSDELLQLRHPSVELRDYFTQRITAKNPYLGSPSFLRVLFRREVKLEREEHYELVTYTFKEYEYLRESTGRAVDRSLHLSAFRYPRYERVQVEGLGRLELDIIDVEDCQDEVRKLLQFDVVNAQGGEEVEKEIALWEVQLEKLHLANCKNWREMMARMGPGESNSPWEEREIAEIRKELRMTEVLLYFKRGHSDKTQRMLEDALQVSMIKELNLKQEQRKKRATKLQQLQCLFQTDCKICFCTQSDDRNKVVYCDACNTSFHQACYGVETIDETEKFYCEVCQYVKQHTAPLPTTADKESTPPNATPKTIRKPSCLLCCKPNFPMRQFNGHFYHVTCLVLFDLVEIKNYRIEFRHGLTSSVIFQRIVENQLASGQCAYCYRDTGMKFPCREGCGHYFHPICAYLNGVHFQLVRSYRRLNVGLSCPSHHPERDNVNQVYLRRFFCDYKGTSNKTDVEFEAQYTKELQQKAQAKQVKVKESALGVMRKGRIARSYKCSQPKPRQTESATKREGSEVRSNPALSENDLTETRRLLRMMSARNQ